MAINRQKISQMTPKGADLDPTDLLEVSVQTGSGYETRSITGQEIIDAAAAGTGTVTSVDLTMPSAFTVTGNPITTAGTLAVTGAGVVSQYVRGDGSLANFPSVSGGGASTSYYLNGSISQGTIGGVTYYEMNKTPILGAGTDFIRTNGAGNGYIASFLTDANDPNLLKIPGGNWNLEFYFSASSSGSTPSFYVELYKYNGTTFTLLASNSATPEIITGGTSIDAYFTTLSVAETVLLATDRLAIRVYVTTAGRTITLHTEDNHLCQVITTFTTGLTALNGLTDQVQNFATGTSGTDFGINSTGSTHIFNLPTASATNRGALSSTDWTTFNSRVPSTRNITINGTTQDLSSDRTWTISTGITVGTTAVTSGTDGRVFFQAGGVVQQDGNFTYDNTLKRLGLKAAGTAATDIPFNVQNSAGTVNLLQQTGVGSILARSNDTFSYAGLFYRTDGTNGWSLTNSHSGYGQGTGIETVGGSNYILSSGTRALSIQRQSTGSFKTYGIWNYGSDSGQRLLIGENVFDPQFTLSGTGNVGIGTYSGGARLDVRAQGALSTDIAFRVRNSADTANQFAINGTSVISHLNGTAPSTNITDSYQQYSADITAGNAAPHFRTENGSIVKLYQQTTGVAASTFAMNTSGILNDTATFDGYTIGQVVKVLRNLGILA